MTRAQHPAERPWHAGTWLVWALAATASLQIAPSPVYVVVVIALATLVVSVYGLDSPYARAYPLLVGLAVVFAALRVALTALTTHGGPDVLFGLPSVTVPDWLGGFTLGSTIEGPVVAQAAAEGFVIVGVIAVFAALNAVVSHSELVQSLPRAFHELGLVVAVGIAFVPTTITAIHDVRDADRARTGGRPVRRGRLVRQIVPVLENGLERAITLAESMDSRGFARGGSTPQERAAAWCGAAGLLALAGAFVALVAGESAVAVGCVVGGTAAVVVATVVASRGSTRVRYRPRRLTPADVVTMAAVCVAPIALVVLSVADEPSLTWATSPLRWPGLSVLPALALLALAAPLRRRPIVVGAADVAEAADVSNVADTVVPSTGRPQEVVA
ncbi:MAG: energy-coupling factor transporter transmembrane component T [Actinomycetota bacterium]